MMANRLLVMAAMAAVVGSAGPAAAWRGWDRDREGAPGTGLGIAVEAGGGVLGYTRGQLENFTQTGGNWNLRMILGTRSYIGGEIAYVGSMNQIGVGSLNTNANLLGSGLEGALRLQVPIWVGERGRGLILPYILGGVGWARYDVLNSNGSVNGLLSGDNGLAVPLGGGLILGYRHLLFDVRAVYRLGYYNNPVSNDSSGTDNWSLSFLIGYEF